MRDFGEADKKKKSARIKIPENPAGLSAEALAELADKVKASLKEGNLQCGTAWKIARESEVPRIAVGEITDRLGIRVSNCQIGCFKVDKIINEADADKKVDEAVLSRIETLNSKGELTCTSVHELALEMKMTPMAVANVANARSLRIRQCQLGCF